MKNEKVIFWTRFSLWVIFSVIIPVGFIGWRYELFRKVGSLSLSGWGLFAIVIIFAFIITLAKYIKAGFSEWSMVGQIITGIIKIMLPLGAILFICMGIRNNIDYFIQALCCILMCEAVAIPVNPMPEWVYKKSKGKYENIIDYYISKTKGEDNK